jgi:general secretion pathway protein G
MVRWRNHRAEETVLSPTAGVAKIFPTTFASRGVDFPARLLPDANPLFSMKIHPPSAIIRRRGGFTLLEMVIVLGIIAVILGGSIAVIGKIGEGAKVQRVDGDFNAISSALQTYKLNAGQFPTTQQGLQALVTKPTGTPVPRRWVSLAKSVPLDPWGAEYIYRFPGKKNPTEFEIISKGQDGMENTADDISNQDN